MANSNEKKDLEGKHKFRIHDDNVSENNYFYFKIITLDVLRHIQLKTYFRRSIYLIYIFTLVLKSPGK